MIKLGVFQVATKSHGFTLSVENAVDVKEVVVVDGKKTFVSTGEVKTVVDKIGFYPKAEQVINRIVQYELSKTSKDGGDLQLFINVIEGFTSQLRNLNKESK